MSIHANISDEIRFLKINATGCCENPAQLEYYHTAIQKAMMDSCQRLVLVDESRLSYKLTAFQIYDSGKLLVHQIPRPHRFAVIYNPREYRDFRFWETIVRNRGVQARVFAKLDQALDWLSLSPLSFK